MDMKDKVKAAAHAAALALLEDYACSMADNHGPQCATTDCAECKQEVVEDNVEGIAGTVAIHMERLLRDAAGEKLIDVQGRLFDDRPPPRFKIGDIVALVLFPDIKAVVVGIYHSATGVKYECSWIDTTSRRVIEYISPDELQESKSK